ncbi:MAG: tetratricopeptide (TPR) repeat protein [Limisphaerales bacterium]
MEGFRRRAFVGERCLLRHEEAVEIFTELILIDPANAEFYAGRGACLASLGRMDEALAELEFARRLMPAHLRAVRLRVCYLIRLERYKVAEAACTPVLKNSESIADDCRFRADIRVALGDHTGAIEDYTNVIENCQAGDACQVGELRYQRGMELHVARRCSEAVADLTQAIELQPECGIYYLAQADVFASIGDRKRAQADRLRGMELVRNESN